MRNGSEVPPRFRQSGDYPLPPLGLIGRIVVRLNEDSRSAVCPRSLSAGYYRNFAAASAFDCCMIINIMSGADRRPGRQPGGSSMDLGQSGEHHQLEQDGTSV